MKKVKIILAVVASLFCLGIFFYVINFIVAIIGGLILTIFGIHISQSLDAYENLKNVSSIIGFIGATYFSSKIYKKMVGKDEMLSVSPKKWYQFKGFN